MRKRPQLNRQNGVCKGSSRVKSPKKGLAASSNPSPATNPKLDEMAQLLAYWRPRLGLSDWLIDLDVVNFDQQISNTVWGSTSVDLGYRWAGIRMTDPDLIPDSQAHPSIPYDMERTLVHELLHVVLWAILDELPNGKQWMEEQVVNQLARALVEQRRG